MTHIEFFLAFQKTIAPQAIRPACRDSISLVPFQFHHPIMVGQKSRGELTEVQPYLGYGYLYHDI